MGKTKRSQRSQIDFLLEEIERIEKENNELKQEVKRLQARSAKLKKEREIEQKNPKADGCPQCHGTITIITIPKGSLKMCKHCGYRKIIK